MTRTQKITILYLYPHEMNTYGDWGNVLVLQKRLEWRGYSVEVVEHRPGDDLKTKPNLLFFGGGQDSGQGLILQDLERIADRLRAWIEAGLPVLAICGGYQLLGREFITHSGEELQGVGALPVTTLAESGRLIGNVVLQSDVFGEVVGFENHSGRTSFLHEEVVALGRVQSGGGNNGVDGKEGIIYKSTIGTYLHGPLLPKNPQVADWLIARALGVSNKELVQLPDTFVAQARAAVARKK